MYPNHLGGAPIPSDGLIRRLSPLPKCLRRFESIVAVSPGAPLADKIHRREGLLFAQATDERRRPRPHRRRCLESHGASRKRDTHD